jgi:FMN-dependent NADH-azoreductase
MQESVSRTLGDHFVLHWREKFPDGQIICRDLQTTPVPHLTQSTVHAFFNGDAASEGLALSDELIGEIKRCDDLLITCPMYNFQIPSSLKAYLDHIVRLNETFQFKNGEYIGLLDKVQCHVLTTMGGKKSNSDPEDSFENYLRKILGFIGIRQIVMFCIDGTSQPEYSADALDHTKTKIANSIFVR